ncbi:MAG: DUF4372 domain-containing protein [Planctomycetaceae bacterium]|nr:DUF4372 domain-containing protein [Planctomycetaceae bacterium]
MIFARILELISWRRFQTYVDRYQGDSKVHSFFCNEYFRVMLFDEFQEKFLIIFENSFSFGSSMHIWRSKRAGIFFVSFSS